MQRPLPNFRPPHLAGPSPGSYSGSPHASEPRHGPPPPLQQLQHSRSTSQPHSLHSPGSGPSYYVVDPSSRDDPILPVPHAIPVSPGDPRLGGRQCMRCGGAGKRMVMFLDMMTCEDCGGTGRIWT
ncbi:hypothetical protein J3R82DRAFT_2749 [Butyriboletus roseoflavus]|nr:hypothetical protein J3R82DRAFT_2749 [Butyriboletus roseoflavus]